MSKKNSAVSMVSAMRSYFSLTKLKRIRGRQNKR